MYLVHNGGCLVHNGGCSLVLRICQLLLFKKLNFSCFWIFWVRVKVHNTFFFISTSIEITILNIRHANKLACSVCTISRQGTWHQDLHTTRPVLENLD